MAYDWIEAFVANTAGMRSPERFRLWAGITCVAAVLERRVWTTTDIDRLFPNMFVILTGEPAAGKSIIVNEVRKLWGAVDSKQFHLGPDNPTKASFLDCLQASPRQYINGTGLPIFFCAMAVACRELGVLIPHHDSAFLEDMSDIYDNPLKYFAPRKDKSRTVELDRPTINVLAAATPGKLGDMVPESAWNQGFMSRLLFIYGVKVSTERDMFARRRESAVLELLPSLREWFHDLIGEFEWDEDARLRINTWINEGKKPEPTYGRLRLYNGRRDTHVAKLAMISAVSAGRGLSVALADVDRALSWLIEAESVMPDVFAAMAQKSDIQLIEDLAHHVRQVYMNQPRVGRKAVHESVLYKFLESKVASERISKVIETAQKSGRIKQGNFPNEWLPDAWERA